MVEYRARFDAERRDIHTSFLDIQRANRDCVYPLHSAAPHARPVSPLLLLGPEVDHSDEPCSSGVCPTSADRRRVRSWQQSLQFPRLPPQPTLA